jgi:hypothetical protein
MKNPFHLLPAFFTIAALSLKPAHAKENHSVEGLLNPFLGEAKLDIKQVHKGGRFPNVVVAMDGSILAVWNGVIVKRSEDGGDTWGEAISVGKGFMGGGVTVNERNGEITAFVEEGHPPLPRLFIIVQTTARPGPSSMPPSSPTVRAMHHPST